MIINRVALAKMPPQRGTTSRSHPRRAVVGSCLPRMSLTEIAVTVCMVGVLVALLLPAGDMDRDHRFPSPGTNRVNSFADVAGDYQIGGAGRGPAAEYSS